MFATFPEFTRLTLENREDFEAMVRDYPPLSDLSFTTLQIWWNLEDQLSVAVLNGNLVIHYYLPFDEENSGYCVVGEQMLEESFQTVLEYLRSNGKPAQLVHEPEFIISKLSHDGPFEFAEEIDYNEYILDAPIHASLEDAEHGRIRRKVNRFKREVEERDFEVRDLDLTSQAVQDEAFEAIMAWERAGYTNNDPDHTQHKAIRRSLSFASLGVRGIGLYVDGKLYGLSIYYRPMDKEYFTILHIKVDYSIPYGFDYLTNLMAERAVSEGVKFINLEMDLGIESLRRFKTNLRPVDFFRKYTVTPKAS